MNEQIKAWVAKHGREVGECSALLEAWGFTVHAEDLRESWEPVAAIVGAGTMAPAGCEDFRADVAQAAYETALADDPSTPRRAWRAAVFSADVTREAMSRDSRELVADEVTRANRPVLTKEAARAMAIGITEEAKRAIREWAWFADMYSGLVAAVEAVIEAEVTALLMRVAGPVTEGEASMGAAFEAVERTGHTVMVAHPAMVMAAEAIRKEAEAAMAAEDAEEDAIQEDVTTTRTDDRCAHGILPSFPCVDCDEWMIRAAEMATTDGEGNCGEPQW
jgi:hypothetical protein